VRLTRPEHPIVRGMQKEFTTADAICHGLTVHAGAEAIAVARDDPQRGGSGKDEPVLLALAHGKGRVFTIALGHDLAAMQERGFLTGLARGTEWAASGKVTLPANLELPRPDADAVKGLLITGGHDHETAFYTLFDGYKDLARMPVASSAVAFQSDLRSKYDVLIMYDFTRDLDDTGKKHLREFVESGKGVVVLHHALLNYQQWPWWCEDTVGGSYRLRPEGKTPSSTVKDSQQIFVTPESEHPITSGIGPFHIVDETYKRMRFSSRIRPLLSTANPNSDRFLAWLGPCTSSRVVAIQLGHGHTAFEHPSYRALVHNAILWSAGRIK
jgi:type 1 glutamine amidotransferase